LVVAVLVELDLQEKVQTEQIHFFLVLDLLHKLLQEEAELDLMVHLLEFLEVLEAVQG
jgi:hypothetical protein